MSLTILVRGMHVFCWQSHLVKKRHFFRYNHPHILCMSSNISHYRMMIGYYVTLGNLRTTMTAWSTTTGSELHCTAQARLVNFVVVVSSTTPNKVESRRPAIHKLRQV